jgi:hypothetical protein
VEGMEISLSSEGMTKNTLIIHLKDLANSEIEGIMNFKKTR